MSDTMDPALVDRRSQLITITSDSGLPQRNMTIAGIETASPARVLSKDPTGPATRLLRLPAGWGTALPGAFTADVEFFVVSGRLRVSTAQIGRHEYTRLAAGRLVGGLRAEEPTLALLFTSAPVRFDTTAGGLTAQPEVHRPSSAEWTPSPDGRFRRAVTSRDDQPCVWLVAADTWQASQGSHVHQTDHEFFALSGRWIIEETIDDRATAVSYGPGGYAYRPAGTPHSGGASRVDDVALAVCRSLDALAAAPIGDSSPGHRTTVGGESQ